MSVQSTHEADDDMPRDESSERDMSDAEADADEAADGEEEKVSKDNYFVTDGEVTIGPVDGDLLVRGIHAGSVPLTALVWKAGWEKWRTIQDFAADLGMLPSAEEAVASSRVARVSDLQPLQLPSTDVQKQSMEDATTLHDASSRLLHAAAALVGADCGWVHVYSRKAGGAMVTIEGIGPRAAFGVGKTIDPSDQALRAAREGRTVLSEPIPGVVGSAVTARVLATGIPPTSVLMVPVLAGGQLLVMLELGVAERASGFTARDVAVAEQVARSLSDMARKRGWHRSDGSD